jgi:hypothetical protein
MKHKLNITITCRYCMQKESFSFDVMPTSLTKDTENFFLKHYHNGMIKPDKNFIMEKTHTKAEIK